MLRGGGAIAGFCNFQERPTYDYEVLLLPSHRSVLVPFLPKQLIGVRLKIRNSSGPRSSIASLTRWQNLWMDGWCGRHNVHNHHYIRSLHIARPRHYADQCRYYNLQCITTCNVDLYLTILKSWKIAKEILATIDLLKLGLWADVLSPGLHYISPAIAEQTSTQVIIIWVITAIATISVVSTASPITRYR